MNHAAQSTQKADEMRMKGEHMKINIYEIGCDYYAAKNLPDVVREYCSCSGDIVHEALDEMRKLTDGEMEELQFVDDVFNPDESAKRSFKAELERMIKQGITFPCAFASSEY